MIIKINQITNFNQIKLLADKVNILGFCVTGKENATANFISLQQALAIIEKVPHLQTSFYFDDSYEIDEQLQIVREYAIDYIEFVCPDFLKKDEFEFFVEQMKTMNYPIIFNGFYLSKDDLSIVRNLFGFELLKKSCTAGFFQIELDSIVDKEFLISPANRKKIEELLCEIPVLYTDKWTEIPSISAEGIYFNIDNKADFNYDLSLTSFTPSQIMRILMK